MFGKIINQKMKLNSAGKMVDRQWNELSNRFSNIVLDKYIIMPDHMHGVIIINDNKDEPCVHPETRIDSKPDKQDKGHDKNYPRGTKGGSIGRMIQAFKSISTNKYIDGVYNNNWKRFDKKLWQRNYYDRIIRNQQELNNVRQYISNNPRKWANNSQTR